MKLYINPENQKLLWTIINQHQFINSYWQNYSLHDKSLWFKEIIQYVYDNNKNTINNYSNLTELNKQTLNYMIDDIKKRLNSISNDSINTPKESVNNRSEYIQNQYNLRQQNYEDMNKKDLPEQLDFTVQNDDEAITDINALVEKQQRERDLDIQKYKPLLTNKETKLIIDKNTDINIDKDTEIINNKVKKSISWGENKIYFDNVETAEQFQMKNEDISIFQLRISELEKKVMKLNELLSLIKIEISEIKNT
tara:strand:- start:633 stop:1388 length:756 start_codon:yes stop_codon:yes gene_type:complete